MNTNLYAPQQLEEVAAVLKEGKVIAFPTDTVFGLGCVYDDPAAVERVKKAKERDEGKPLPMMCSSAEMTEKAAVVSEDAKKLMRRFCPGALTLVMKKREEVPAFVTNGRDTIAIRIPDDPWILELIDHIGKPLLVTSANISGEPSLQYWQEVREKLNGRIDGIVTADAGSSTASTIIDLSDGFRLLRQGKITEEELKEVLK
ncbi:MAG: threonylcarbamoyl-AMP synthase [Erysipelotrichaceae bacterium]|nr:threonylcarbamoyl-AMP synthase [Erysipelotrichaceae bacterium]